MTKISSLVGMFLGISSLNNAMDKVKEVSIVKPFFANAKTITTIKTVMDDIEKKQLGYDDYSKRTGLIWSDVLVKRGKKVEIVKEYDTPKATEVGGKLMIQSPQSILKYPVLKSVVTQEVLPKMFEEVGKWTKIPEELFAQIFFQRCNTSEAMDWHQDPGEDYDPQANYSLVLMLSEQ